MAPMAPMAPMDPRQALRTLDEVLERGRALAEEAGTLEELERARTRALGRKSTFSEVQRALGTLAEEDRREVGRRANEVREALQAALEARRAALQEHEDRARLEADRVDVTLSGRRPRGGSLHPLTIVEREILDVFVSLGYRVAEGPEVETSWYNFDALNIGPDHPARKVTDIMPETRFVAVGDMDPVIAKPLQQLIQRLGLQDRFVFLGFRSDVPEILSELDVFVLSSVSEGFPLATLEAMAAARPLIVTRCGGPQEIVEDGRTGLLIPPADPDALAGRICELLADPGRAAALGRAARVKVESTFTLEKMIRDYECLYERVLTGA